MKEVLIMKYFYNQKDTEKDTYYTREDMKKVRIYPATEKLMREFDTNPDTNLVPISTLGHHYSWEFGEFNSEDEARAELRDLLNTRIYETEHDL